MSVDFVRIEDRPFFVSDGNVFARLAGHLARATVAATRASHKKYCIYILFFCPRLCKKGARLCEMEPVPWHFTVLAAGCPGTVDVDMRIIARDVAPPWNRRLNCTDACLRKPIQTFFTWLA